MPELPEVECVRRTLSARVVGRRVERVRVTRPGVIRGSASPTSLLAGDRVAQVLRHGKQLALVGEAGGCVAVHLGMSGQLCAQPHRTTPIGRQHGRTGSQANSGLPAHTHIVWQFDGGLVLRFTDPRRFGGLWTFPTLDELTDQRWSKLGPDALIITPAKLHAALTTTRRGLKAALLDQRLVAGLGNIYVDELLFGAKLHPAQPACAISRHQAASLVRRMRTLLTGAVARGGSTLRDYVDADGVTSTQQTRHRVYGRSGGRCPRRGCRARIQAAQIAGRTTAWCPSCQPEPRRAREG